MSEFHFGQSPASQAFFERNPNFYPAFKRILRAVNCAFGRSYIAEDRQQDVVFNLGEACREDFLEVTFLATHGFGTGALKTLRGLFERAVALAYIVKYPEKAERFVQFGAIQEYKVMDAALRHFTEEEFDLAVADRTTAAQIREARESAKSEFQVKLCSNCSRTGTAFTWDLKGVLDQALDVGGAYPGHYLGSYAIPNLYVHATVVSAFKDVEGAPDGSQVASKNDADAALLSAGGLLLLVLRSQDDVFQLDLLSEIHSCEKQWIDSLGETGDRKP